MQADTYILNGGGPELSLDTTGGLVVELVMTADVTSKGQVFWATADSGAFSPDKSVQSTVTPGAAQTYEETIPASSNTLTRLRIDPLAARGEIEVDAGRVRAASAASIEE